VLQERLWCDRNDAVDTPDEPQRGEQTPDVSADMQEARLAENFHSRASNAQSVLHEVVPSLVMALSTTFMQCAPETTEFGKMTQNKFHFAVQGHSRSPILISIKSSYTTSYQDNK